MTKQTATILITVLLCGATLSLRGQKTDSSQRRLVSLIRLLANPNDLDGQRIMTIGFLDEGGGTDGAVSLFVSESDGRNTVATNALGVETEKSAAMGNNVRGRYVVLTGTYHAPTPRKDWGYIDHVTEIKPYPPGTK